MYIIYRKWFKAQNQHQNQEIVRPTLVIQVEIAIGRRRISPKPTLLVLCSRRKKVHLSIHVRVTVKMSANWKWSYARILLKKDTVLMKIGVDSLMELRSLEEGILAHHVSYIELANARYFSKRWSVSLEKDATSCMLNHPPRKSSNPGESRLLQPFDSNSEKSAWNYITTGYTNPD